MPTPTSATRSTVAVLARQRYKARHRQALPAWKVVRGDRVQLLGGKDAGKQGVVQAVLRQQNRVIVAGLNVRKRKVSATPQATGFIHLLPSPVHVSSVALVDPVHNQATRVRVAVDASGRHVRVSRRSGAVIPKPVELAEQGKGKRTVNARTDTPQDAVAARSIQPIDFDAIAGFIQQRREAALQRQRQEEQQRMQRRERRKARTALTAHLNPAQAADALALAPSIEAAQLVQPQPQPQPQYSFAASSPHSPTMAPPLRRHFPARLPSLPPYPYSRASTLVGQWKERVRTRSGSATSIDRVDDRSDSHGSLGVVEWAQRRCQRGAAGGRSGWVQRSGGVDGSMLDDTHNTSHPDTANQPTSPVRTALFSLLASP